MAGSCGSRDRTKEFLSTVKSLENVNVGVTGRPPAPLGAPRREDLYRRSREFNTIAGSIGKDISSTYSKLEKLTLLAKRKTIFDDRPQEIQELTFIIKEDMNCLNRQIGQLQQIARSQQQGLKGGKHQASHTSSVVVTLQAKLASMTSHFKQVLQVRTANLKESRSRQQQFSQDLVSATLPPSAANGYPNGSLLAAMEEDENVSAGKGDTVISMENAQQLTFQRGTRVTDTYLQSRAETMQSIESTIVELGGIFQQLAQVVKEQEETMGRIDQNVENTALQVEGAHGELLKYFQGVTSNRWLMVKIFGVLIFFFIFFVIFMA